MDRGGMENHRVDIHCEGRVVTVDDIRYGVSNQDHVYPGIVGDPGGRVVIGGNHGELLPTLAGSHHGHCDLGLISHGSLLSPLLQVGGTQRTDLRDPVAEPRSPGRFIDRWSPVPCGTASS